MQDRVRAGATELAFHLGAQGDFESQQASATVRTSARASGFPHSNCYALPGDTDTPPDWVRLDLLPWLFRDTSVTLVRNPLKKQQVSKMRLDPQNTERLYGGEGGIRTHGARKDTLDFESSPFGQLRHLSK